MMIIKKCHFSNTAYHKIHKHLKITTKETLDKSMYHINPGKAHTQTSSVCNISTQSRHTHTHMHALRCNMPHHKTHTAHNKLQKHVQLSIFHPAYLIAPTNGKMKTSVTDVTVQLASSDTTFNDAVKVLRIHFYNIPHLTDIK